LFLTSHNLVKTACRQATAEGPRPKQARLQRRVDRVKDQRVAAQHGLRHGRRVCGGRHADRRRVQEHVAGHAAASQLVQAGRRGAAAQRRCQRLCRRARPARTIQVTSAISCAVLMSSVNVRTLIRQDVRKHPWTASTPQLFNKAPASAAPVH